MVQNNMVRKTILSLSAAATLLLAACGGGRSHGPVACEDLKGLALTGATVVSATSVPAGTFTPASDTPLAGMPAFCRVVGRATPSSDSQLGFEVWLPQAQQWNGRYLQIG